MAFVTIYKRVNLTFNYFLLILFGNLMNSCSNFKMKKKKKKKIERFKRKKKNKTKTWA